MTGILSSRESSNLLIHTFEEVMRQTSLQMTEDGDGVGGAISPYVNQYTILLIASVQPPPNSAESDKMYSTCGSFSATSTYSLIAKSTWLNMQTIWKIIWRRNCPQRI